MLYIFDLDGTLRITRSGKPCPNSPRDQVLLPNVRKKLHELQKKGHIITGVSNQGGVSYGYMTEFEAWKIQEWLNTLLDNMLLDIRLNFYHPSGKYCYRYLNKRKPKPDLLVELIEDWQREVNDVIYIGNQFSDEQAADAACTAFEWAHNFFEWGKEYCVCNKKGFFPINWFAKWECKKYAVL